MQCPNCQFDNPEDSNFCLECGRKLEQKCPQCEKMLPPNANFCNACGHKLRKESSQFQTELSFDDKLAKIQKYLPKGITEKILSQKDRIEGERKQVTVMFCDMEAFTPLSESLGIEEAYSLMDQVYEILIHKVHDYEGTVNEMTGDGIMALFGAPIAVEDAPQRAINSALAIQKEINSFSELMGVKKRGVPIRMRIGIHSGPVVVGTVGNDLRVEFKAIGDTVNLASRMESIAEPGTIYVTGETFRLTEGLFRFEDMGERHIKGKDKPIRVYRVIAQSSARTRFDVSAERGLTPFIGRDRELRILMDTFEWAKTGRGQVVSIMSEAGVGKSRLLYEFRKEISNEDVTFLEGHCLSYSRSVAYQPVIEIIKANFNINEKDGDSEIREKVQKGLKLLGADEASTEPFLLELLSVKESGVDDIPMSPEAIKDRTIGALRHIVLKGSENRPLIIAIEDLHWIDKSSEDLLKDLMESIPGAKVFLIFTYRPEFVHTWGRRSYHNQVNLNRLSNRESLKMAGQILGTNKIVHDLENLILEKTEGIPFFIEEFIRSLKNLELIVIKDDGVFLKEDIIKLSIPSTIQDVIMARVDSLPDDAKETLQVGSAIEREFSLNLLKLVTSLSENNLLSSLSILKDSELLYERGVYPQCTYIFKHALTREVVYDSILTSRKKKLHEQIGDALEKLHRENIIEHYGILARHYILSDSYEKGAKYSSLAGKQARKKSSYTDAISYAKKGVSCLEMLPQTDDIQRRIIDERTALSNYCMGLNYHYEGMQAVAPIVDLAQKTDYKKRLSRIYVATGTYNLYVTEDINKGIEDLKKAKALSEETGDFLSLWFSCYFLAVSYISDCDFEKSPSYFQMTLDLSEAANNITGICYVKGTIASQNYTYSGKTDLAYETSKESLELANQTGDIHIQQMAYSSFGSCCFFKGFFNEAETNLLQATSLYKKTKHVVWGPLAYFWLGILYLNSGDSKKAQYFCNQANLVLVNSKILPSFVNLIKSNLTYAKVLQNNRDINLDSLFEYAKKNKIEFYSGDIAKNVAGILMTIDDQFLPEAEKWINKAIEAHKRNHMPWYLAQDYAFYAELHKRKGNRLKAKETLGKAIEIFKECGADGWVEKYEQELPALA